jgi:hypothetical protein
LKGALRELEKRTGKKKFEIENILFKEQLAFVQDPSYFKQAVTSRRAGKTVSCVVDLLYTAFHNPEVVCLYITLSRSNAKRLIWPEIKRIDRQYDLGLTYNEQDLSAHMPNGAVIYCSGASDRSEIEKFRGLAVKKVYIDEAQSFPPYLKELIDDVLAPSLMDYAGSLAMIGTPGPVPTGEFFDATKSKTWSSHHWTYENNPHLMEKSGQSHKQLLSRELKRRGVKRSDPSIQREWFGKWVVDLDSLVYHYDEKVNNYKELDPGRYTYLMGVDVGYEDADAIAVLAWSEDTRNTYLVEEVVTRKQGLTELVEQIEALRRKYDVSKIVMDMGALGKKIGEELIRRYRLPVEPAEKTRKNEYIELLNDDLRTGRLKVKKDSQFAEDAMKLEWDLNKSTPDRKVVSTRFHSDICDAVLYAWRESYSFTHQPKAHKPRAGTREWYDDEVRRMEEAAEEYFKKKEEEKDGIIDYLGFDPGTS